MAALTIDGIVDYLVKEHSLQRREASDLLLTMIDDLKRSIADGDRVKLIEFGSFAMRKQYYHRKRRDIELDEETPPFRTPSFSSYSTLRARIQRAGVEKDRDVD